MIKLQNNTLTRTPLPDFLIGLQPESLRDLTWTDPDLGVTDCAWLPESDISQPLPAQHKYEGETLELSQDGNTVLVTRTIVPWTQEEIDADLVVNPRHITQLAFISRFTDDEAVGIDLASIGATVNAAKLRRYQAKINAAKLIDLNFAETRSGVQALETIGLLAASRSAQILDAAVMDVERP